MTIYPPRESVNKNLSAVHLYSLEAAGEPQVFPLDRQEALNLKKAWKAQGISVFCSTAAGGCGGELVPAVAEWAPGARQMIPHLRHKVNTKRVRECLSNVERQQTTQHWLMQLAFAGHFRRAGFQVTVEATHSNRRRSDLLITGGVLGERVVALEIQLTEQHVADDAYRTSRHYLGTNRKVKAVQWVRGWESEGHLQAVLNNAGELVLRNGPLPAEGRLSDAEEEQLTEQTFLIDSEQEWVSAPLETIRINPEFTVDEYGITRDLLVSEHLWDQGLYYEYSRKLAAVKKIAKTHEKYMRKVAEVQEAARKREAQRKAEQKTWIGWTEQQEARSLEEQEYFQRHKRPWGVSEGRFRRDRAQARTRSEGALLERLANDGWSPRTSLMHY